MTTNALSKTADQANQAELLAERQIAQARRRIRLLDLSAAFLGFFSLLFLYALVMVLLDGWLELSLVSRQIVFGLFALGAVAYLFRAVVWPLAQTINPYFAARQIEAALPEAKNSVVNWLDLKGQPLAPAFRRALSQRAAKDLARVDLEEAISGKRALWALAVAGLLFVVLFAQFVIGGRQFLSLVQRAFVPFSSTAVATRTQLILLEPKNGDVSIPVGRAVSFRVKVEGHIPDPDDDDAIRLLYRYQKAGPYDVLKFERGQSRREWIALMPAFKVRNGFCYRVAGGDAVTDEFQVLVRATPLITSYEVLYHYRPYLRWADQKSENPDLKAMRGTEVSLIARANCPVASGRLEFVGARKSVEAEPVAGENNAMRFQFVMDKDDEYRIWFTSKDGDRNRYPLAHKIEVLNDFAPNVQITAPLQDTTLPVNGVLQVEGMASDDFGITGMTLHVQLSGKEQIAEKPYRQGKRELFVLPDGSYAQQLDYRDYIELSSLRSGGQPLKAGMILDCWLEATDACDYPPPGPNVGRSQVFRLKLGEPVEEKKQQELKEIARREQQQHETQQDRILDQKRREQLGRLDRQPTPEENKVRQTLEQIQRELERRKNQEKSKTDPGQPTKGDAKDQGQKREGDTVKAGEAKTSPQKADDAGKQKGEGDKSSAAKENQAQAKNGPTKNTQQDQLMKGAAKPQPNSQEPAKNQPGQAKNNGHGSQDPAQSKGSGKNQTRKGENQGAAKNQPEPHEGFAKNQGKNTAKEDPGGFKPQPKNPGENGAGEEKKGQPPQTQRNGKGGRHGQAQAGQGKGKGKPQQFAEGKGDTKPKPVAGEPGVAKGERPSGSQGDSKGGGTNDPKSQQAASSKSATGQPQAGSQGQQPQNQTTTAESNGNESSPHSDRDRIKRLKKQWQEAVADEREAKEKMNNASTEQEKKEAAEALKKAQARQRDAEEKLERLEQNAADPLDREAARQARHEQKTKRAFDELAGADEQARQRAEQEFRQQLKNQQEQFEKLLQNLQSNDPETRQKAQKQLQDAIERARKNPPTSEQLEQMQRFARENLSGEERKRVEKILNDLAKESREQTERLRKKLEKAASQLEPDAKKQLGELMEAQSGENQRDVNQTMKQLASKDENIRQQAREKLRRQMAQDRELLKRLAKDLQSNDAKTRQRAREELERMKQQMQQQGARRDELGRRVNKAWQHLNEDERQRAQEEMRKLLEKDREELERLQKEMQKLNKDVQQELAGLMQGLTGGGHQPFVPQTGSEADPRFQRYGGDLQLEKLPKTLPPEILKKFNMTPEEYARLREAVKKMKPVATQPDDPEQLVDPSRGGGNLENLGPQRVTGVDDKGKPVQMTGRGVPPPEFRKAFKEWSKRISRTKD
ncbi:MAG: hypothetical protein KatS3mg105_2684 [Gemmatales bacterium]|nr:MAG: hypothetical protein KatS3mg105_2684 [Gemmatales bacterium]